MSFVMALIDGDMEPVPVEYAVDGEQITLRVDGKPVVFAFDELQDAIGDAIGEAFAAFKDSLDGEAA